MGISAIALGHHADDQAETLLLRMVRGTAPDGLAGMGIVGEGPGGVRLLRPLLPCTRSALASWYRDQGLPPPLEDPTNFDPGHTPRNFIRLQLAPLLGQLQPRWVEAFGRLADRAREDREALAAWAETAYVDLCVDGSRAPVAAGLAGLPPAVQRRVLQRWQPEWDTARTEQVIGWLAAGSPGHLHLKGGVLAVRDGRLALMASSAETLVPCRLCLTPTPGGPSMPEGHSPPDLRVC